MPALKKPVETADESIKNPSKMSERCPTTINHPEEKIQRKKEEKKKNLNNRHLTKRSERNQLPASGKNLKNDGKWGKNPEMALAVH